jgi:hypothetical protein
MRQYLKRREKNVEKRGDKKKKRQIFFLVGKIE